VVIEYFGGNLFPCFGVQQIVVSDNGTQFKSHEFADFLLEHGIQHLCTGAYSPQPNAAERVIPNGYQLRPPKLHSSLRRNGSSFHCAWAIYD